MRPPLPLTLACAALAGLLAACGQTGPLYMPDEGVTTPVEIRTAPAEPAGPAAPAAPTAAEPPAPAAPAAEEPAAPKKDEGEKTPPPDAGT